MFALCAFLLSLHSACIPSLLSLTSLCTLKYWIRFLDAFVRNVVQTGSAGPQQLAALIEDLRTIELPCDNDDSSDSLIGKVVFTELANMFGGGCVRPEKQMLPLATAIRQWNRFLTDDLGSFLHVRLLQGAPGLNELLQLLAERSRDPLKPTPIAPFRSILYFSVLGQQGRVYQSVPMETFVLSSSPGTLSLPRVPDMPIIVSDLIQVYCCNASRQRRLLPSLLRILEASVQGVEGLGTMAALWLQDLIDRLRIDLILLLGHLRLLRVDEHLEAAAHLSSIFDGFAADGRAVPVDLAAGQLHHFSVADPLRFKHRWDFLPVALTQGRTCSSVALDWFGALCRGGLTGHSFRQQDWWEDENICSSQHSQNNYTFTMYTSERDE